MGTRYRLGDTVEIFGQSIFVTGKRHLVSKGIGTVKEIRGGGHYADYTNPRRYIIQLVDKVRICSAHELKLIKRSSSSRP